MLFELLCIAGAGLIGYKAITDPKGTKETAEKLLDAGAKSARDQLKANEFKLKNGKISSEEYREKQANCQRFLASYAEHKARQNRNNNNDNGR